MIDNQYFHTHDYPSGLSNSTMQKNMDYYNSEDCAHFVSEALIAGGLTSLSNNPPGDNLATYGSGFPGSYGIVGVYRLADYLAGYDLPVFPPNATAEKVMQYNPTPGSYAGSPHASLYYVMNDSMLPAYFLSPGDVVMDGGVGNGHAMLYIGNGQVVQTDPAQIWHYYPGTDYNISFFGYLTLNGKNVSSIYLHMPTISTHKTVRITGLSGSNLLNKSSERLSNPGVVKLIASFPNGVGFGNYTYKWSLNGKSFSTSQVTTLDVTNGTNNVELQATGSNGTAYYNMSINVGNSGFSLMGLGQSLSLAVLIVPVVAAIAIISLVYLRRK